MEPAAAQPVPACLQQHTPRPSAAPASAAAAPLPPPAAAPAGGGSAPQQPRQRRQPQQQQQQQRQRRRRPPAGDTGADGGADDDDDDLFLDPLEAAKLRRAIKAAGRQSVVDAAGVVVLPPPPGSSTAAEQQPQQQQQQRGAAGAAPSDAGEGSSGSGSGGSGQPRQKLFVASQLQAAVPGSGGRAPALPIVRPAGSSGSGSGSSADRARQDHQQQQPPSSRGSRSSSSGGGGGPPAAAFFSRRGWREVGASDDVINALASLGITQPSHIQAEAFRALAAGSRLRHVALADQAGSGKTLAYLLPLLQQLKQREAQAGAPATAPGSPSIIVMTPTTELAQQVGRVVRALSGAGLRVRGAVMTGGQSEADRRSKTFRTQCELLAGGVDVLVATPGRLLAHLERGSLSLANTAALVLDEVDVLAGGEASYSEAVAPLRAAAPGTMRCVLVSATLPQHTFDELQELFPGLGAAFGPGLHKTATGLVEELVDCSGGEEVSLQSGTARKLEALVAALARVRSPRTVVFCNKIETCRVVENALGRRRDLGLQVVAYHEAIREELRSAALAAWLTAPAPQQPPMVLVCTDRTSRGLDSMWCGHVVLFEFPRDPSEYVRRVGRTARGAGGAGVVTVLVLGKQVGLARDILARNREGAPVHRLPRLWSDK